MASPLDARSPDAPADGLYGHRPPRHHRWPAASPSAVPQSGRRTFAKTRPHMPMSGRAS